MNFDAEIHSTIWSATVHEYAVDLNGMSFMTTQSQRHLVFAGISLSLCTKVHFCEFHSAVYS